MGTLYFGDNLDILRRYIPDQFIERPSSAASLDDTFKKAPKAKASGEKTSLGL
jgi:hypothetical protein